MMRPDDNPGGALAQALERARIELNTDPRPTVFDGIAPQFAKGAAAELEAGLPPAEGEPIVIGPPPKSDRHRCPWPGCYSTVRNKFWGCTDHWNRLPMPFRLEILRNYDEALEVQSLTYQMAFERARNWAADNPNAEPAQSFKDVKSGKSPPPNSRYSSSSPSLRTASVNFSAGWTDEGGILLFWPATTGGGAEYLVLDKAQAGVLGLLFKPQGE